MLKFLVPVDGSESSIHPVQHLIDHPTWYQPPLEIHLLNVQTPLHGDVGMFLSTEQIRDYYHDEGIKALAQARQLLDQAGFPHVYHIGLGQPAEVIARYALEKGCDQIVMGTRGLGSFSALFLGSVALKVLHLAEVPVLMVK